MSHILFQSSAPNIGRVILPTFALKRGETVCVHCPPSIPGIRYEALYELGEQLEDRVAIRGIQIDGKLVNAQKPLRKPGLLWRWRNASIFNWLTRERRLPEDAARRLLIHFEVDASIRFGMLPWDVRSAIGVAAALLHDPDILVYDALGGSIVTAETLHRLVDSHPHEIAAVFLAYPSGSPDGRRFEYRCAPGARCLECRVPNAAGDSAA